MGEICDTWSCGNVEEQTRKRLDFTAFCRPSRQLCLYPSRPSAPPSLVFSRRRAVFAVSGPVNPISSPPLSSSSLFFLLCPSHPLVLTPELSPLKSPGNKLWCLRSSLLSRSPHPSSQSADTSAVILGPVQKKPGPSTLYSTSTSVFNVQKFSPYSLPFSFSLSFSLLESFVYSALCSVWQHCARKTHTNTQTHIYAHTYTVTDTQLGPSCIQRLGFGNQWRRKKKRGKEFK